MTQRTTAKTGRTQSRKTADLEVSDIDDEEDEGLSFAFYGKSGTGKTTLAADWPKPMLYIDVMDKGSRSIRDIKGIKRRRVSSWAEFDETYWWLKENPEAYKTVVIDTLTQLQRIVVEELTDGRQLKKGQNPGDWGTLTQKDWGTIAATMKEGIINFRDLVEEGMDIIFIAQDRAFNVGEDEDAEESLAPEIGPALSPSVVKTLNASVDVIGNTFIRETIIPGNKVKKIKEKVVVEYCLRLGPNSLYVTKVRKPKSIVAPAVIVDPDYEEIMAIIEGE